MEAVAGRIRLPPSRSALFDLVKPLGLTSIIRSTSRGGPLALPSSHRNYAAATNPKKGLSASRKQVTVINNNGRIQWKDLKTGEKIARTTQQTFSFGLVLAGVAGTVLVVYFLYQEVFSSDSPTKHFNQAVDRIRGDSRALELLGSGRTIRAFGEPSQNKWTRNRPLASSVQTDRTGIEHLRMHFNVEGSTSSGVVFLHMVKGPGDQHYQYRLLALDVPGHARIYLENADGDEKKKKPGFRMLGVQWR